MSYILGLATMGESAAVLLRDGHIAAAAEEERFTRVKHEGCFPLRSAAYCLASEGIALADVSQVAVYWQPWRMGTRAAGTVLSVLRRPQNLAAKVRRAFAELAPGTGREGGGGSEGSWFELFRVRAILESNLGRFAAPVRYYDHHLCHMASAFYASPFEEAAVLTFDGAGEEASTTLAVGTGEEIKVLGRVLWPHSLGHFYASMTGFLGFKMLDGEYKMMGLAPYNSPDYLKVLRSEYLISSGGGRFRLDSGFIDYHEALAGRFGRRAVAALGPPRLSDDEPFTERHEKIAASAQAAFEEVASELARWAWKNGGEKKNLCIAGGCGLNCTANGKLLRMGIFEKIFVPPVPHDAGGALGAALLAFKEQGLGRPVPMEHASFGPRFSNRQVGAALAAAGIPVPAPSGEDELIGKTVQALADGRIVAWFQGRMEFGPRALGNRSFLADPRRDSIRETLNAKIKKRELFRPFAPSVTEERAGEFFEIGQPSPFMNVVAPVRASKRQAIPAVVHVDGSARVHTVSPKHNSRYWKLLDRFGQKTGVPVLLNTSFNIQEPVVCTPEEAIATFLGSRVDVLVIGDYFVPRPQSA